ncbi:MAG: class E sortase [Actinomycetota bacterium]
MMQHRRPTTRRWAVAALIVLLAACGGAEPTATVDDYPVFQLPTTLAAPTLPATLPATSAAPATAVPVTEAPTTTAPVTAVPTTAAADTTAPAGPVAADPGAAFTPNTVLLPQPQPPPDPAAPEPRVDIGRIEIPRIGLDTSMFEGVSLATLDNGPGHWPGTAMPGQIGNVVIAGHRVSHKRPFRHIDQLEVGDEVILTTADGRFVYVVAGAEIVGPDALRIVDQTAEPTATLFACHPPGSTRQRYVVHLVLRVDG